MISRIPGVCGGNPMVGGQRMTVHGVVDRLQLGWSEDEMLEDFPTLERAHLAACLAYYEDHREEMDRLIAADHAPPSNEELALMDRVRAANPKTSLRAAR
ncbi:MAG: DUF433 domain-containing protein [Chthoniobacteraceae bacterium]